jgi:hypothetical protein
VSACVSVCMSAVVYSMSENLAVSPILLLDMAREEDVLFRIEDCICAYLLLFVS